MKFPSPSSDKVFGYCQTNTIYQILSPSKCNTFFRAFTAPFWWTYNFKIWTVIWLFYLWMLYIRGTLIDSWNIEFFLKLFFDRPAPSVVKSKAPVDLNDSYICSKSFNNLNVKCHLELIWNEINLWDLICFCFCCYCCNIYDLISRPTHSSTPSLSPSLSF